jgi:hypothetical protein
MISLYRVLLRKVSKGLLALLFLVLIGPPAFSQKCLEGDCQDGYGKLDWGGGFDLGFFKKGVIVGPGLTYWNVNGSIRLANFAADGSAPLSIVEFQNGQLQFGARKVDPKDQMDRLHNGFDFTNNGLSKVVDGVFTPLEFKFDKEACLIGDCENGFGAEYLIVTGEKDTTSYLYAGNYKDGSWDGNGAYYEFSSGDYFVGTFTNNSEWTGAFFNSDAGRADFMVDGQDAKTMSYSIPDVPPGNTPKPVEVAPVIVTRNEKTETKTTQKEPAKVKKRGSFWKTLGDIALVTAALIAEDAKSTNKTSTYRGAGGGGGGSLSCLYFVETYTQKGNTEFVIYGPNVIEKSYKGIYASVTSGHKIQFFESSQAAYAYEREKANAAIKQGYDIKYKPLKVPTATIKSKGCANK